MRLLGGFLAIILGLFLNVCVSLAEDDVGDSIPKAMPISCGSHEFRLHAGDDRDYFKITISERAMIYFYTEGDTDTKCYLGFLNEDQEWEQIAYDYNSGVGKNCRIVETLEPGTYYFIVTGEWGSYGHYILNIDSTACENVASACEDEFEAGKEWCREHPVECGVNIAASSSDGDNDTSCAVNNVAIYDVISNTLLVPNFENQYWLKFVLINVDPIQLELQEFGPLSQ